MDEARRELHEGNLSLNGDYDVQINGKRVHREASDLPVAEITPEGQLIVAGTTIARVSAEICGALFSMSRRTSTTSDRPASVRLARATSACPPGVM